MQIFLDRMDSLSKDFLKNHDFRMYWCALSHFPGEDGMAGNYGENLQN